MSKIRAWHFVRDDKRLRYDDGRKAVEGETLSASENLPLELCAHGMHGSARVLDALGYAPGSTLCLVELSGEIIRGDDKLVGRARKCIRMIDAERLLHEFACDVAGKSLLECGGDVDRRLWDAIATKRRWLDGDATDGELDAAWFAARDAADAAGAAGDAALYAARRAAVEAAEAAARAAAEVAANAAEVAAADAARDVAWAAAKAAANAARDAQSRELERRVLDAMEVGDEKS